MKTSYTCTTIIRTMLVILFLLSSWSGVSISNAQSSEDLQDYAGSYEGRDISISGTTLSYKRDGMPSAVSMERIEKDHYKVIIPPGARVRGPGNGDIPTFLFNRNASGAIESLSMVNPDNTILATYKKSDRATSVIPQEDYERLPSVELPAPFDQVLRDYEKAWRDGQDEVLAELFVDSGFVTSNEGWIAGKKAIQQKYANTSGDLRLRALDFAMDDSVGYIIGAFGYGENANESDLGIFVLTLRKSEENKWLIVADIDKFNSQ